jgi:hypothetical protein
VVADEAWVAARPEGVMPSVSGLARSAAAGDWNAPAVTALAGRAMVNENRSRLDPGAPDAAPADTERSTAVTETRSPGAKRRAGANCVPWFAGWAESVPG